MFQFQEIWFPDGEEHFPQWMARNGQLVDGKGTYQIAKLRAAMQFVKNFRTAIDVGGHVGLWSMQLVKQFRMLHAFEPVAAFRECFERNLPSANGHLLYNFALGVERGKATMKVNPADTGGTHICHIGGGDVDVIPLDEFDFQNVDFIKIDCEGFELQVLKGAVDTLNRCHPCVIVEQKPHKLGPNFGIKGTPAVDLLVSLGAKQRAALSGDYVMSWDD